MPVAVNVVVGVVEDVVVGVTDDVIEPVPVIVTVGVCDGV